MSTKQFFFFFFIIIILVFFGSIFIFFSQPIPTSFLKEKKGNNNFQSDELQSNWKILYQNLSFSSNTLPQTVALQSSILDIYNQNTQKINIGYRPDGWNKFTLSSTGQYLVRWNNYHISVSTHNEIENFKEIVQIEGPYDNISDLLISPDEKKILYVVMTTFSPSNESDLSTDRKNSIYGMNIDGTEKKILTTYPTNKPAFLKLQGINSRNNEFYWTQIFDGGMENNFTIADLSNGYIKETKKNFPNWWYSYSLKLSKKMESAYISTEKTLTEYSLINKEKRILFTYSESKDPLKSTNILPAEFLVSPLGEKILLFDAINRKYFSLDVTDGKIDPFANYADAKNLIPKYWSPDEKYIWFEDTEKYYLFDTQKNTFSPFIIPNQEKERDQKENIAFIGWLKRK